MNGGKESRSSTGNCEFFIPFNIADRIRHQQSLLFPITNTTGLWWGSCQCELWLGLFEPLILIASPDRYLPNLTLTLPLIMLLFLLFYAYAPTPLLLLLLLLLLFTLNSTGRVPLPSPKAASHRSAASGRRSCRRGRQAS